MKKRVLTLFLCLITGLSLVACGKGEEDSSVQSSEGKSDTVLTQSSNSTDEKTDRETDK